jgi:hypothetical protein
MAVVIEAREQIRANSVSSYPYYKSHKRKSIHQSLVKKAFPDELRDKVYITPEEMMRRMHGKQ